MQSSVQFIKFTTITAALGALIQILTTINLHENSSGEWIAVNSAYSTLLFIVVIVSFIHFSFWLVVKKNKSLMKSRYWMKTPLICLVLGSLSILFLIIGFMWDPLFNLLSGSKILLYFLGIYFILNLYLFIFSLIFKHHNFQSHSISKVANTTYLYILILLIISILFI